MQFNDTTNKTGIIQRIEKYAGLGDTSISANATLLKIMTGSVNDAFDEIMPFLLSYSGFGRWDDLNNTDHPIMTFNLVSGQQDYSVTEDDNALDILNITDVRIYTSATGTQYVPLDKMSIDDERALDAQSPHSTDTGVPDSYLERGNVIFLSPKPNYSATSGVQVFFEREQSYFASTDTTKEPGIPKPFHRLLPMIAAHEWLLENEPANSVLITRLEAKIATTKKALSDLISARNPTRSKITMKSISFI